MPVYKPWVVYDEWRKTYGKSFIINGLSIKITGFQAIGNTSMLLGVAKNVVFVAYGW